MALSALALGVQGGSAPASTDIAVEKARAGVSAMGLSTSGASVLLAASAPLTAPGDDDMTRQHYSIEDRARRVAHVVRDLDLAPPDGSLADVTEPLAAEGVRPRDLAPSSPVKFTLPTHIYVSAMGGRCPGLAIAAVTKMPGSPTEDRLYLSLLWDDGEFAFNEAKMPDGGILAAIEQLGERRAGC